MIFKDKKVLIVGLGRSGKAAIRALHKKGARLSVYDEKQEAELKESLDELKEMDLKVSIGVLPVVDKGIFDLVVVSPGFPLDRSPIPEAIQSGVKVIGELELAYLLKSKELDFYAVTGTNGKTTTTSLLHHILSTGGIQSAAGGNIGIALCNLVDSMQKGVVSVEASSFQLDTTDTFCPHICGILNITEDHLDRHKTMEAYIDAKASVFKNQQTDDYAVLNYEDNTVRILAKSVPSTVLYFSTDQILTEGVCVQDDVICVNWQRESYQICNATGINLRGRHNLENILCAVGMSWVAGVDNRSIAEALKTFTGVRHRLEEVDEYNGVLYINDSKGTNPDSTIMALKAFDCPVVLIAGGRAKGGSYDGVAEMINRRVKELIVLGEAKELIKSAVLECGFTNIHMVETFEEAVYKAHQMADTGDVVLLSPACASWDMFPSYEHRGDLFCELVHSIIRSEKQVNGEA